MLLRHSMLSRSMVAPMTHAIRHSFGSLRSFHSNRLIRDSNVDAASPTAASGLSSSLPSSPPSSHDPFPLHLAHETEPLRIGILGSGISGLTLAQQLQRKLRQYGRSNVEITIIEKADRSGGWMRSQVFQSGSSSYLLERGPRSFMYRMGEMSSESTLELLRQLQLGRALITADTNAAKRFVWNGTEVDGRMVLLPSSLTSFWKFPHRSGLIQGLKNEWTTPSKNDVAQDESVSDWITRRFNKTVAEELIDPMIAGIYAGDPNKLSMASCLSRLPQMESRSGGILRDMFFASPEVKAARRAERARHFDASTLRTEDTPWMTQAKKVGIYSLHGGVATLTRALEERLQSDRKDPFGRILPGQDAKVTIRTGMNVTSIGIDGEKKPMIEVVTKKGEKELHTFDHVFTTFSSSALGPLLASSSTSSTGSGSSSSSLSLSLPSASSNLLASQLSSTSMPIASMWVVNIVYESDTVLAPEKKGFGILIPTKHAIQGKEILGITFDSCVFPNQCSSLKESRELESGTIPSSMSNHTRLTVMIGGDRQPELVDATSEEIEYRALEAVHTLLGIDPNQHRPILIDAMINKKCIPQYYVGHASKVKTVFELLKDVAHVPSSMRQQIQNQLEPASALAPPSSSSSSSSSESRKPFTLLGTSFGGVSLNDCIHHATTAAEEFVQREIKAAATKAM